MLPNLKKLREEIGLSQKKLADMVGVTQQAINRYENNENEPDISTLIRIANCFHVSVDDLIGNTDSQYIKTLSHDDIKIMEDIQNLSKQDKSYLRKTVQMLTKKE